MLVANIYRFSHIYTVYLEFSLSLSPLGKMEICLSSFFNLNNVYKNYPFHSKFLFDIAINLWRARWTRNSKELRKARITHPRRIPEHSTNKLIQSRSPLSILLFLIRIRLE